MEKANVKLVRKNWKIIDDHVLKITDHDERSYKNLIAFFDKPIKTRLDRNIFMTRAIIYWMYRCGERKDWQGVSQDATPLKLMKTALKDKKTSRQEAFKKLCNAADIPCECVNGISKLAGFEPGQRDFSQFRTTWNKVQLEGSWWPVYPDWIMMTVLHDSSSAVAQLTDFWFLTDPEVFIYKCYPDTVEDQMLPPSRQVRDSRKFSKLPLLSYHFFRHNLKLTSEDTCVLDADDGRCTVSFKADSAYAKTLNFYAELTIPNKDDGKSYDPERLVFSSRRKGQFFFEVRCPVLGIYGLTIRGGPVAEPSKKYVTARIECLEEEERGARQLPVSAGHLGWGVGPAAHKAGLAKPTMKDPKIVVTLKKPSVVQFTLDKEKAKDKQFAAKLQHGEMSDAEHKGSVEVKQSSDSLQVKVTVRTAGEYALVISAAEAGQKAAPVCNYLLSTLEEQQAVADEYEYSSDGFSDIDGLNLTLEREVTQLNLRNLADEYEDSSDGFSDIDEENLALEREVTQLEEQYNELLRRAESSMSTKALVSDKDRFKMYKKK